MVLIWDFKDYLIYYIIFLDLQINKDYAKFESKGLAPDLVSKNDIMFGNTVATGEFAWTPSSNDDVPLVNRSNNVEENIVTLHDSEDGSFEKSIENFLHGDDDISDSATNLGKRQRKGKEKQIGRAHV